ncbi:MAG: hypothetical protein GXY44_16405 [Phycisphaerales bacterium]|nr:hypothetical protein [Phycisphaerales bacterium]
MDSMAPDCHETRRYRRVHALIRQYGISRCLSRFTHDAYRRWGLLKRRFPVWKWADRPLSSWLRRGIPADPARFRSWHPQHGGRLFFPAGEPPKLPDQWAAGAVAEADALRQGRFRYFSALERELGFPAPDWFVNPFTAQRAEADRHWCDQTDFESNRGDIKYIWEPSRFCWAYALARAYARDGRDLHADTFWTLFESWMAANPPQCGPNWMCGQEIAIRLMACIFAAHTFWNSPATTDERIAAFVVFVAGSAERIAGNINYARIQMGNHAVSEAAGIWTVGVLFPELAAAKRLRRIGQYVPEDEVRRYNWEDGSYVQHSTNYQRLMLHNYAWCLRLARLNQSAFPTWMEDRILRSAQFLYQLQDPITGRLPNYGPNDGALVLPLNDCDYLDYRPVIELTHAVLDRERLYETGSWTEDVVWLCGEDTLGRPVAPTPRESRDFTTGGYYTLRSKNTWAMIRCHSYHNRPNQADLLHLDLWWQGINVLRDSGSFSYFDPQTEWNQYFLSTAAHNTIRIGGVEQMIKGPRFQWFSLARSKVTRHEIDGEVEIWEGEHYGYRRLTSRAIHRRSLIRLGNEAWLIVDDVLGNGEEEVELFWQLADVDYILQGNRVTLNTPVGILATTVWATGSGWEQRIFRGIDTDKRRAGWVSHYYGQRDPAPTLLLKNRISLPVRLVTLVNLGTVPEESVANLDARIQWRLPDGKPGWQIGLAEIGPGVTPIQAIERSDAKCVSVF